MKHQAQVFGGGPCTLCSMRLVPSSEVTATATSTHVMRCGACLAARGQQVVLIDAARATLPWQQAAGRGADICHASVKRATS